MELEHSHWEKSQSCSPVSVLCRVTCHLFCCLTKCTVAGTALDPISTLGMPAPTLVPPRHCFHRTTSANQPGSGPRTTFITHLEHSGSYKGSLTAPHYNHPGVCSPHPSLQPTLGQAHWSPLSQQELGWDGGMDWTSSSILTLLTSISLVPSRLPLSLAGYRSTLSIRDTTRQTADSLVSVLSHCLRPSP